jgi:hypothetical protein
MSATSAEVLDHIMQVVKKGYSDPVNGPLVKALNDVLDPQANLCSFGRSRRITKRRVAELVSEWGPGGQWAPLDPDNDDDQEW